MEANDDSLESRTITALLSFSPAALRTNIQELLTEFSSPLKTNFENRHLWLRFGLALSLTREAPRSALQAFNECLRIDQTDPLPAMLAAKISLLDLDDPVTGLELANEAIERCERLFAPTEKLDDSGIASSTLFQNGHIDNTNPNSLTTTIQSGSQLSEVNSCNYKNIAPLLSKCYLLSSIMHAYIYESELESIKHLNESHLSASLHYLDCALCKYSDDYLVYFHKALHDARQRSYSSAISNARQSIKLNPHHVLSMQLLILSISALKLHDEALLLCEATLHEFEDNLLLLYIKCNLEQCLVETRGFRSALNTAQYMLKCVRKSPTTATRLNPSGQASENKQSTNLFADDIHDIKEQESFQNELSVWLLVAEIFLKIGSVKDAESCVDEGSNHVDGALSYKIMFVRGLIAKEKNNLAEAKSYFQTCLALRPRHAKALQQMGHLHFLLGSHSIAEKFLKDSLDVDSQCDKTWYYLSLVFIETNQHDKARESKEKSFSLESSSPIIPISFISRLTLE